MCKNINLKTVLEITYRNMNLRQYCSPRAAVSNTQPAGSYYVP
jgi:hypothetical protein